MRSSVWEPGDGMSSLGLGTGAQRGCRVSVKPLRGQRGTEEGWLLIPRVGHEALDLRKE